jgi:uncharacterized membrane protein
MKVRFLNIWERLRANFWFVPTLMASSAALLAFVMLTLDEAIQRSALMAISWAYIGSPEGARALLSTVAGSIITVAGVTFSITIAALTLASSQFGPRLLRNFLRDTGNQLVLGTFIATFLYCLLVLRTIHGYNEDIFVPNLSISVGVALAIASLGVLIYFIHHVSVSIQADAIIATVGKDLETTIERLFPEQLGTAVPESRLCDRHEARPWDDSSDWYKIISEEGGYVQAIDTDKLLRIATQRDIVVRLLHRPGQFVVRESAIAHIWPDTDSAATFADQINDVFIFGSQRTLTQDVLFATEQLVEIAVRALSPGINDPFTAIACIDQLGAGLCCLARRAIPDAYRYDDGDQLRVIAEPVSFADIVDAAFDQIRQYGRTNSAVTNHLLETITSIGAWVQSDDQRVALLRQAEMIARSQEGLPEPLDRAGVAARYQEAVRALAAQAVER